jgi:hypothetical protein
MKCKSNHNGHANSVLAFAILYIGLFILDIATGIIMIVYGAWFLAVGRVSTFTYGTVELTNFKPLNTLVKTV